MCWKRRAGSLRRQRARILSRSEGKPGTSAPASPGLLLQYCDQRGGGRRSLEGSLAGHHLIQHGAETEDIRTGIQALSLCLLRATCRPGSRVRSRYRLAGPL